MSIADIFESLSSCTIANVLPSDTYMDCGIKSLWQPVPRIAGPAYTVHCPPGDNLMLHIALHKAPEGSIVVVQSGDTRFALAGGNVCHVAKHRGIKGFVLDGVIRDLAEIREAQFPVFARGLIPKAGKKEQITELNTTIVCGGVTVNSGDYIVADEDGIVVIASQQVKSILEKAEAQAVAEAKQSIGEWREEHKNKMDAIFAYLNKVAPPHRK